MALLRRCLLLLLLSSPVLAAAEPRSLTLAFMITSGAQRSAWLDIVDSFRAANPDIHVTNLVYAQEDYKQRFDTLLQQRQVDLAFWFAGHKLTQLIANGTVQPLDTLLTGEQWAQVEPAVLRALRQSGQYWALPVSYYPWGLLYRRSIFAALGLREPENWPQFLLTMQQLQYGGMVPIAVGAKSGWPAAAWFDYLNMRLHGALFHRQLLAGRVGCRDARLEVTLQAWQQLLGAGMLLAESPQLDWQAVLPYLYHGRVGMVLTGSFVLAHIPRAIRQDLGFFPFPDMGTRVPRGEDAPLDVLVWPTGSQHALEARRFASFLFSRPDLLARYGDSAYQLAPLRHGPAPKDAIMRQGKAWLRKAERLSSFFDRDAVPLLRERALPAFRQFLTPPHDRQQLQRSLCQALAGAQTDATPLPASRQQAKP